MTAVPPPVPAVSVLVLSRLTNPADDASIDVNIEERLERGLGHRTTLKSHARREAGVAVAAADVAAQPSFRAALEPLRQLISCALSLPMLGQRGISLGSVVLARLRALGSHARACRLTATSLVASLVDVDAVARHPDREVVVRLSKGREIQAAAGRGEAEHAHAEEP